MRRRAVVLASAASAVAILGGWQLGAVSAVTTPVAQGGTSTAGGSSSGSGSANAAASGSTGGATTTSGTGGTTATAPQAAASGTDGTYAGTTVSTRFGDVQVRVTISGGAITDVTAMHLTDHDGRSISISNRAAPILRDEVLQAQSASVSMVGGATYTSAAYLQSLQSALDQAGF
ncbi:FMN-binding protein [Agromyces bauzanensis]